MDRDWTPPEAPTSLEVEGAPGLSPPTPVPSVKQVGLGSELAETMAPSATAQHLSDYACLELTVPPLWSTPDGGVTAQLHEAKPVYSMSYTRSQQGGARPALMDLEVLVTA